MKYLKLVDGVKSNASGFEYKIGEINISDVWNPNEIDPKLMGGFNFSVENKILRWVHRGDTIYDVEIPEDAEVIDCPSQNCPHGVFRSNKIILLNPRKVTEEMVMDFYFKSDLPQKTYYQCIVVMLYRNYINLQLQAYIRYLMLMFDLLLHIQHHIHPAQFFLNYDKIFYNLAFWIK